MINKKHPSHLTLSDIEDIERLSDNELKDLSAKFADYKHSFLIVQDLKGNQRTKVNYQGYANLRILRGIANVKIVGIKSEVSSIAVAESKDLETIPEMPAIEEPKIEAKKVAKKTKTTKKSK